MPVGEKDRQRAVADALVPLREATAAPKCWACGCFHNLLTTLCQAFPGDRPPGELEEAVSRGRERLQELKYPCLGCEVCYPALVINALSRLGGEELMDFEVCPGEKVEQRRGWPPLPGDYQVLRYHAAVAVCTLMDAELAAAIARQAGAEIAIIGTLQTENLGIERLIQNISANPHLRFLVVCGEDSQQAVGHWPGQSLLALAQGGTDDRGRIISARGKRPLLRNITRELVEHFRRTVELVDLLGTSQVPEIIAAIRACAARDPGPAAPFQSQPAVQPIPGYLPPGMAADPAGYFVVYVDRARGLLSLEHYLNEGLLDLVIEGASAAELYYPAIERGLVSRLDHAAYLGRELARAEHSLISGEPYIQDAAPEGCLPPSPIPPLERGCSPSCREAGA